MVGDGTERTILHDIQVTQIKMLSEDAHANGFALYFSDRTHHLSTNTCICLSILLCGQSHHDVFANCVQCFHSFPTHKHTCPSLCTLTSYMDRYIRKERKGGRVGEREGGNVCLSVCMCVRVSEWVRERERAGERERLMEWLTGVIQIPLCFSQIIRSLISFALGTPTKRTLPQGEQLCCSRDLLFFVLNRRCPKRCKKEKTVEATCQISVAQPKWCWW